LEELRIHEIEESTQNECQPSSRFEEIKEADSDVEGEATDVNDEEINEVVGEEQSGRGREEKISTRIDQLSIRRRLT